MLELIIAAWRARLGEYDGSIAVGSSTFGVIGCVIMSTVGIVGCVGDMGSPAACRVRCGTTGRWSRAQGANHGAIACHGVCETVRMKTKRP